MITKIEISKFEKELETEKKHLVEEIKKLETPTDFGDDVGEKYEEEADEDEELENRGGAADALKERLIEVESAINKIAKGEYGKCEMCGGAIEKEVLKIAPESRYCKSCKKKV